MKKSKKTFKRVLAVALAALMIGSSLPIASFAATDQDITNLESAITAYENKMARAQADGKVYTNMKPAYDAYIDALEIKDAFKYGDSSKKAALDAQAAITTLTNASNAMTYWDPATMATYSVEPKFSGDTQTGVYAIGSTHNKMLATTPCVATSGVSAQKNSGNENVEFKIGYAQSVLVYDGAAGVPKLPVIIEAKNHNNTGLSKREYRYNYGTYPTNGQANKKDSQYFGLDHYWYGNDDTGTYDWTFSYKSTNDAKGSGYNYDTAYYEANGLNNINNSHNGVGYWSANTFNSAAWEHQSNVMSFKYQMQDNEYLLKFDKTTNPIKWFAVISGAQGVPADGASIRDVTTETPLYILNVATVRNAAMGADTLAAIANVKNSNIDHADYGAMLAAIDNATKFTLNGAKYVIKDSNDVDVIDANLVNAKATEIQTIVEGINNAKAAFTPNAESTGYQALRTALGTQTLKTVLGNGASKYTEASWNNFKTAYDEAVAVFTNITTTSYNDDAGANTKATNLNLSIEQLVSNVPKVDVTALQVAIDNAGVLVATEQFLKASPLCTSNKVQAMGKLKKAVNNAKTKVWGSADKYGSNADALDLNEANTAIVTEHTQNVEKAIKELMIDFNSTVPRANNQSMTTMISEAGNLVREDYSSLVAVDEAVAAANAYMALGGKFDPTVRGNAKNLVIDYTSKTIAIYEAIQHLQPSFSKLANGTIINAGERQASVLNTIMQDNQNVWSLGLYYTNNQVLFRTNNDPFRYNVNNFEIRFSNPKNNYDQFLDSVNFDEKVDSKAITNTDIMWRPKSAEINSNTKEIAMSDIQKNTFKAGTSLTRTAADGTQVTFSIDDISVGEIHTNYQGRQIDGTDVALGVAHNWTSELSSVEGAINPCRGGVPVAKGTTTTLNAAGHFSLPGKTAPTLSAATVPTYANYAPQDAYFSGIVRWCYNPTPLTPKYYGYGTDRAKWSPSVTVVDVSTLFTLMDQSRDILNNHYDEYTQDSITALESALAAANTDFAYGDGRSVDAITAECVTRYNNLWTAYSNLKEAPKHQHVYGDWSKDANNHWHECTDVNCPDPAKGKTDVAPHSWDNGTVTKAATCDQTGILTKTCTVCGQTKTETIPATGNHSFDGKPEYIGGTTPQHKYTCTTCDNVGDKATKIENCTVVDDPYVAPTAKNPVGKTAGSHCSVCNGVIVAQKDIDATTYFNALEEAKATMNDPNYNKTYTDEARKAYEDSVNNNTLDFTNPKSKEQIDTATGAILEAKTDLENAPKGYTVKLQPVVNGVVGAAKEVAVDQPYATPYTVDATAVKGSNFIERWEICDDSAQSVTPIHSGTDTIDFTITSDTTVKVYISEKPIESQNYTKVTLYNQYGTVYNVSYVGDNDIAALKQQVQNRDLALTINGNTIKAPSLPFYNVSGWVVKSEPNGELNLKPEYTFVNESASYSQIVGVNGAKVNGLDQATAKYDSRIHLTGGQAYAIVKNGDVSQVLTYINSTDYIHAPHNSKVYIAVVDKAAVNNNASSAITGTLITDKSAQYGEGFRGASFNCMFNVPADARFVECGAIGTMNPTIAQNSDQFNIENKNVFQAKSYTLSIKNEYTINFISDFVTGEVFYGRSYVKYIDASGQPQTVYGNIEQITL